MLIMLHVIFVQKHGMSVPTAVQRKDGVKGVLPFFPNFLLRDLMGWLFVLACLAALAAFLPAHLGEKADPFAPAPAGIRPEWYFMFMFQTLKYLPAHILGIEGEILGVLGFGVGGLLLALVPFLDKGPPPPGKADKWTFIALGIIAYILALTYLGYTADVTQ
jgi:quinol-cytochrome oxidoreductase complex cytochrome b subunit